MSERKQVKEKVSIGFYPDILDMIDEEAENQHRSRSNMLDVIVRRYFNLRNEEKMTPTRPLAK